MANTIINTIPSSRTDELLRARRYDLLDEYLSIIEKTRFDSSIPVVELATGTGRTAAILARLGYDVMTGDISLEKRADALARIGLAHDGKVSMMILNMERLPFQDESIKAIVSLNTIHELDRPLACVRELVRVHHHEGTLVVGDFNETGFAVFQELHQILFAHDHARGHLPVRDLKKELRRSYESIAEFETALNVSYICRQKIRY